LPVKHLRPVLAVIGLLIALTAAGCNSAGSSSTGSGAPKAPSTAALTTSVPVTPSTALPATGAPSSSIATTGSPATILATLPIRPSTGLAGYSRDQFGPAWADVNHNGCDTRNDVLNRDLTGKSWQPNTHNCVVVAGTLADPYSGSMISFAKAQASVIQIDHVVALGNAWSTGARGWTASRREQFANDPLELLAVSGRLNQAKGDADAAGWLPPNAGFDCTYVARQIDVKAAYGLWVTPPEHQAMATVLARCGEASPAETTPATSPPAAPTATTVAGTVYYASCDAVRAAGKAPLHVADPGYRSGLDGDHDGTACE
jgi:hypothetical protein